MAFGSKSSSLGDLLPLAHLLDRACEGVRLENDGPLLGARVVPPEAASAASWDGKSRAVTAVRRASSDFLLNPHFHSVALDGLSPKSRGRELTFHVLPRLTNDDAAVLQIPRTRIVALLRRKGVLAADDESGAR